MDERTGGGMNDPVPLRQRADNGVTPWQSLKVIAFMLILLGPVLPITVFLWRIAVGPL